MRDDWEETYYHGYRILGRTVPSDGDFIKWVAEIFYQDEVIFQFKYIISGTAYGRTEEGRETLKGEGLKRIHVRIDFGEYNEGEVYEHNVTSTGEEISHPFTETYQDNFVSPTERLTFHILDILRRIKFETPGHLSSSQYDMSGWAYYLNLSQDLFIPVLEKLDQENLISVTWVPNPEITGSFLPASGLGITAQGINYFEELEQSIVVRMRETIMPDIEENAFQIARVLYETNYYGNKAIVVKDLKERMNLDAEQFDLADDFLLEARYCNGTMGGEAGLRSLTKDGVTFIKAKMAERFELSSQAEDLSHFLYRYYQEGNSFVSSGQIMSELEWTEDQFFDIGQELIDEGLAEEKPRNDSVRIGGLGLTSEGRRAIRRNFRRPEPMASQLISQHYGDQIEVGDIGDKATVAVGREASAYQGLSGEEISEIFLPIYEQINADQKIEPKTREEVNETVELIEEETKKGDEANEKALKVFFRNLAKMAPDIFDVVVATIANPGLGIATAIRKIAVKAKEEAEKSS